MLYYSNHIRYLTYEYYMANLQIYQNTISYKKLYEIMRLFAKL